MPITIKYLGIDFGSSATTLVGIADSGKAYLLEDTVTGKPSFASAVAVSATGKLYFCHEALVKSHEDGVFLEATPKEDLLSKADIENCKRRVLAFFDAVLDRAEGKATGFPLYDLSTVEAVCFGHPSYYRRCDTEDYNTVISDLLTSAFSERYRSRPAIIPAAEPLLAAIAYGDVCGIDAIRDEGLLLVVDCGGHTIDLSLVRAVHECTSESGDLSKKRLCLIAAAPPASINENNTLAPLGKQMTMEIADTILEKGEVTDEVGVELLYDYKVEEAKCRFFNSYPARAVGEVFSPAFAPTLKCRLTWGASTPIGGVLDVDLPTDMAAEVRFDTFASHVRTYMKDLERYGVISDQQKLFGILFAGGASRMSPLRESVKKGASHWLRYENGRVATAFLEVEHPTSTTAPLTTSADAAPLGVENAVGYGAALVAGSEVLRQDVKKGQHRFTEDTATRTLEEILAQQLSAERALRGLRAAIEELAEYRADKGAPITSEDLKKILGGELPPL